MTNFVRDNLATPKNKIDARPPTLPSNQVYTAAEWNRLCTALEDLRSELSGAQSIGFESGSAGASSTGTARIRNNGNALEASVNGRAYVDFTKPFGAVHAASIGILPTNTGTQNSDAFDAWQESGLANTVGASQGGGTVEAEGAELQFGKGFYNFARTMLLRRHCILSGIAGSEARNAATVLKFPINVAGILVAGFRVLGDRNGSTCRADGSVIRHLSIQGGQGASPGTNPKAHGIILRARATVEHCAIAYFGGDGINIDSSDHWVEYTEGRTVTATGTTTSLLSGTTTALRVGDFITVNGADVQITAISGTTLTTSALIPAGSGLAISYTQPYINANLWRVKDCTIYNTNRSGIYCNGADANAGYVIGTDTSYATRYGVEETSFLGNTYVAHHCDNNTLGSYFCDDPNNRTLFLGCYHEGGQPVANLTGSSALWLGGLHDAGRITGGASYLDGIWNYLIARSAGGGNDSNSSYMRFGSTPAEGQQAYMRWFHVTKGDLIQRMDIGGEPFYETYSPNQTTSGLRVAGFGAVINTRAAFGSAHQFYPAMGFFNGLARFDASTLAPVDITGSYYRTYRAGDQRAKVGAAAGDVAVWVCTSPGTVGTYTEGRTVTSSGSNVCTLSAPTADVLHQGDKVVVNGVTTTINAISGTSITFANSIPAGSGLAIAFSPPVFAELTLTGNGADDTATPGNVTQNVSSGRVAIAAGANSVTVTNSKCTSTSRVYPVLQSLDATLTSVPVCVPANGSFTIYGNANATAAVNVGWEIR